MATNKLLADFFSTSSPFLFAPIARCPADCECRSCKMQAENRKRAEAKESGMMQIAEMLRQAGFVEITEDYEGDECFEPGVASRLYDMLIDNDIDIDRFSVTIAPKP